MYSVSIQQIKLKIYALISNGFEVSPRSKGIVLLVSLLVFVGGIVFSVRQNPNLVKDISWSFIALILLVGVPITVCINAIRFILTGKVLRQRIPIANALNITVLSTAANMLPLPGGILVRIAGLKTVETSYKEGVSATILIFAVWAAMTCLYSASALCLMSLRFTLVSMILFFVGIVLLTVSIYTLRKMEVNTWLIFAVSGNELVATVTDAFRLWLCFLALSETTTFIQSSVLTISAVAGSAVGVIPAGLGLREAVTALIGPVVSVTATAGFVAAALNRLLGLAGILPIALVLLLRNWFRDS